MAYRRPSLGLALLAVYLLLEGLTRLVHLSFSGLGALLGLVAIAAGVLLLVGR